MGIPGQTCYTFDEFRLDAAGGVLFKNGKPLPLPMKAVELLRILVESGGRAVRRDELMARVWPAVHVEDANLTVTISLLRKVLGDRKEAPQYIETLPKRGYRFVAAVEVEVDGSGRAAQTEAPSPGLKLHRAGVWAGVASGVILLATAMAWQGHSAGPKVIRVVQLTHTGRVDTGPNFATDGARLYFTQRRGGHWGLYQVAAEGGEPAPIATPFPNTILFDISPDKSTLLVGSFGGQQASPVWILAVAGGPPRRLGDVIAHDAVWSPDGQWIVYSRESTLYRSKPDGSTPQPLATVEGCVRRPRVNPDGRLVRFSMIEPRGDSMSLWQVRCDGTGLRRLSPLAESASGAQEGESDGIWTPDRKYFLFRSHSTSAGGGFRSALWMEHEAGILAGGLKRRPSQLYVTPMRLFGPIVNPDCRRLFFVGKQERFELSAFDPSNASFTPFLSGMSAGWVTFSRDRNWIAYVSLPDGILWKSRADGTERVPLSAASLKAFYPRWSPDGSRIGFMAIKRATGEQAIYVVPSDGGRPEEVVAGPCDNPTWSRDGDSLLFMKEGHISVMALASRQITVIPHSEELSAPAWSPDGRYVSALSADGHDLLLYDFDSQRWSPLAHSESISHIQWSVDGRSIFFQDTFGGAAQPVYRVSVPGGKLDRLTPERPVIPADVVAYTLSGITPDGAILATLTRNNSDLYAMELELP